MTQPAIERLRATWDAVIDGFLEGEPPYSPELKPWFDAYRGRRQGAVHADALPEPWFGRLDPPPVAVFLALNPGQPFLGDRPWSNGVPMPDLQSRAGVFANEIREAGSYSKWAEHFPDWDRWAPTPNRFFTSRRRFARDWFDEPRLNYDDLLNMELYPWHSVRFTANVRLDEDVVTLLKRYVLEPIAASGAEWAFAFGKPWFKLLERLGLSADKTLSTRQGDTWPGAPKDRVISVFTLGGLKLVAEMHSGGAGPPKSSEVAVLRELLND